MGLKKKIKNNLKKITSKLKKTIPVNIPVLYGELLKNRVAVITGGTSGIGFAIAEAFLRNGAIVVITGRNQDRINNILGKFSDEYQDKIFGVEMNNADFSSINIGFEKIKNILGDKKIDILINNAGVSSHKKFSEMTEEEYSQVLDTNIKGTYFISQVVSKYMKDNQIKGNILNIASSSSLRPAISPYCLSKWSIRGFTLGLAKALIPYGITVNGIAPGPTATPMLMSNNSLDIANSKSLVGRYALPEEIANLSVILVSELGRMVVGDILYATGGCGNLTIDDIGYGI